MKVGTLVEAKGEALSVTTRELRAGPGKRGNAGEEKQDVAVPGQFRRA